MRKLIFCLYAMLNRRIGNEIISLTLATSYFILMNLLLICGSALLLHKLKPGTITASVLSPLGYCLVTLLLVIMSIFAIRPPLLEYNGKEGVAGIAFYSLAVVMLFVYAVTS